MEESGGNVKQEEQEISKLPDRLEELRLALGLNQTEFAAGLGISLRTYTNWKGGTRIPAKAVLAAVARFGASADWLADGTGGMFLKDRKDQPSMADHVGSTDLVVREGGLIPNAAEKEDWLLHLVMTYRSELQEARREIAALRQKQVRQDKESSSGEAPDISRNPKEK